MSKNINFPILGFSQMGKDSRFTKLRVKVMHDGVSRNPYDFSLPVIAKAQPTLKNIPLLAFVKKVDGSDNLDFAGHEFEYKITRNGIETVYLGRPIGMIPETNNYAVKEEDGKNFVFCDAYIWNDYANEALEVMQRDGYKKVSMEAKLNDYNVKDDGIVEVYDYSYTGVCLLGEDVEEAMTGARAQVINSMFSVDEISAVFAQIKQELDASLENFTDEIVEEPSAEETIEESAEEVVEEVIENAAEEAEVVEPEEESDADFQEDDSNTEPGDDSQEEVIEESIEEPAQENTSPDFAAEIEALKSEVTNLTSKIETLETENAGLKSQLEVFTKQQKEESLAELFSAFTDLTEQEIAPIKEKALNMELSDVEVLLFAARGRKTPIQNQDSQEGSKGIKFSFDGQHHVEKPIWADLVEKYKK